MEYLHALKTSHLQYVILNPESLKNGQITTATQIAWLWSYNGENFTYDPDGDAITNISIGGIPSSAVIGSITGNIGFATQFSTPGQYQMTYQVTDARGAKSNILKVVINVESPGTNNRPVCQIIYAPTDGIVRTEAPLVISWANSYDNDAGDSINDVRGLVYKNGSENSEDISKYIKTLEKDKCVVTFAQAGSYEIWMSVSDKSGAWSDWVLFTITVKSGRIVFLDVKINTHHDDGGLAESDTKYVDYFKSNQLAKELYEPDEIVKLCSIDGYPVGMPYDQLGTNIEITGTIKYDDGAVAANQGLNIIMPMSMGPGLFVELKSDANGNFSYSLPSNEYWETIGLTSSTLKFPFSGDFFGKRTQYAHYSKYGVLFCYSTELTIETKVGGYKSSKKVSATDGIARVGLIGGTYYFMENQWNKIDPPLYT